ncbi:2-furoate---CoA ligase [Melghirimyces profundicolus]|uniref:2-furoate---CoA ligase n=1 Tax=Melghirimyces profundicolus TaxID=1242148 RepID=A0A2T6C0F4_9BACL|nr:class I adenylate-forming enzyme family protein [Melghirimyces profundicolus]PTX61804.1 2-furoate---CoA ligase [Melghirimyces profundicolus]
MNLGRLFEFAAERHPERVALVQDKRRWTYAQLNQEVNRMAVSLQKLGLGNGDRIAVLMNNRMEMMVLFWAAQKIGAVFAPINIRLSAEDIKYCVNDLEAKALFFERTSYHAAIKDIRDQLNERPVFIGLDDEGADLSYPELIRQGQDTFEAVHLGGDDLSVILYTSGTVDRPKGVPHSHNNEYASVTAHIIQQGYEPFDSTLGAIPLYHTMGLHCFLSIMMLNGKFVVVPEFDSYEAAQKITEEGISCLYLTPTMYHDMVNDTRMEDFDFTSLRTIGYAGSPMSKTLISKCDQLFRPEKFVNHYGSTEVYTFTTCTDVRKKPGCAGKPGIHQNIRLVSPDTEGNSEPSDIVSPGEMGEIIVDTRSVEAFKGYWNRPDATRKAIRKGWYFTGDLGVFDDEGELYVIGRLDEMILSGGENIHPHEIESVLSEHPAVKEAVVIGEQDDRWGQIISAFIVPKDRSVTVQDLDLFCKEHQKLSNYKRPRKYVFVSEIPRMPSGKILRRKLRNREMIHLLNEEGSTWPNY